MAATRRISRRLALNSDEISQELKPERTEKQNKRNGIAEILKF